MGPCFPKVWVHVGIWYILRAQRGSHIPPLRPKCIYIYISYSCTDSLDSSLTAGPEQAVLQGDSGPYQGCYRYCLGQLPNTEPPMVQVSTGADEL